MVAYNPPNQSHNHKSNGKVIGGAIIMILGIFIFFCAVFVPIMFDNIFLMFPFFFGGFIIIIIGVVTLMIGIKNRSIATGIAPRTNSQIESRNQGKTTGKTNLEIICSYCGTSNNIDSEFCIGCNSKL